MSNERPPDLEKVLEAAADSQIPPATKEAIEKITKVPTDELVHDVAEVLRLHVVYKVSKILWTLLFIETLVLAVLLRKYF